MRLSFYSPLRLTTGWAGGSCEPQSNDRKFLPLGEGGEAETLFRLDGWGTTNWVGGWATLLASPFGRGVLRKQDGEGVLPL